jgi:hypothetical protein
MTDANTPTWLQENAAEAPSTQQESNNGLTSVAPPPPPAAAASGTTNQASGGDEEDPDLPGVILTMRLANMGAAIALVVVSVCTVEILYLYITLDRIVNVYYGRFWGMV